MHEHCMLACPFLIFHGGIAHIFAKLDGGSQCYGALRYVVYVMQKPTEVVSETYVVGGMSNGS